MRSAPHMFRCPASGRMALVGVLVLAWSACDDERQTTALPSEAGTSFDAAAGDGGRNDASAADALTADYRDGSRLKAQWWRAEGAESLFAGWYDTELETPCRFEPVEEGGYRCLPVEVRGYAGEVDPARCGMSQLIRVLFGAPEEGALVASYGVADDACGERPSFDAIYRLGAVTDAAAQPDCDEAGERTFAVAERLAFDRFVAAKVERTAAVARLAVQVYVADDGAREPRALYDVQRGHECYLMLPDADGIYRCMPRALAQPTGGFSDATCSERDLVAPVSLGCPSPEVAVYEALDSTTCKTGNRLFEVGDAFAGPGFGQVGEGCEPKSTPDRDHSLRGREAPPDTFAAARVVPLGTGRLRPLYFATLSDTPLMPYQVLLVNLDFRAEGLFFDAELATRCRPRRVAGGQHRCVPAVFNEGLPMRELALSTGDWSRWADSTCSTAPLLGISPGGCAVSHLFVQDEQQVTSQVFALTAPEAKARTYAKVDGACREASAGAYQAASEVDLSTFAEVER